MEAFLERHALRPLDAAGRVQALRCLELQRHRLLMYTSCGWFFDEISGIETVQVLRYAARVLQLARTLGGDAGLEAELVRRLAAAPSNVPELRDGAGVWRRHVAPSVTDLARVAAHYAIAGPSEGYGDPADVHAFRVERLRWARVAAGEASLAIGRVRVTARLTTEQRGGGRGGAARPRRPGPLPRPDGIRWRRRSRPLGTRSSGSFRAEGRRSGLARSTGTSAAGRTAPTTCFPTSAAVFWPVSPSAPWRPRRAPGGGSTPAAAGSWRSFAWWRAPSRRLSRAWPIALLARAAREELAALAAGGPVTAAAHRLRELVAETRSLGIPLGLAAEQVVPPIQSALGRVLEALRAATTATAVTDGLALLALGTVLEAPPDLWAAQNAVAGLWREGSPGDREVLAPLMSALGFAPGALAVPREQG